MGKKKMGKKLISKKAKVIVTVVTLGIIVVGAFTGKALVTKKIQIKVATMKQEVQEFEKEVSKLVLGDKEYESLLNQYKALVEEKEFKNAEELKNQIYDFIANLEKANLSELEVKVEEFKKLDTSILDEDIKKEIEAKLTLVDKFKLEKNFKAAFDEVHGLTNNTEKIILEKQEEEQRRIEEEKKKQEEEEKKKQEEEQKKIEESNNSKDESIQNDDNSSSNGEGSSSGSLYMDGSVESYIAQSPTAQYTDQIIGVVADGSSAQVYLLEKANGVWSTVLQTSGLVGSQGVGQASEYVSRTPKGSYGLGFAFGTGANPGTILSYRQITNDSYWISDVNSPYYNTWQEGNFAGNGNEHMVDYPTQYRYGITLNYDNGVGGGSAFFLHCNNGSPTAGCISVPTNVMLTLMQTIHGGAHIINVNSLSELANY